jgi:hypothetical protein
MYFMDLCELQNFNLKLLFYYKQKKKGTTTQTVKSMLAGGFLIMQ